MKDQFSRASASASRGDVRTRHRAQRIGHQARMQIALGLAGIRRRHQFGPRQIGHDEFRRRHQPAMIGAAREVMARGDPEFSHVRSVVLASVLISPRRSTSSAGSTSPSTSWKVKALACACNRSASAATGRGLRVRKRSRISPFSTLRCTASKRLRRMFAQRSLRTRSPPRRQGARPPMSGAPNFSINWLASRSIIVSRSASVASVTMASVDHPKLSIPRKPERSATRCFWPSVGRIPVPEHERAGNRPFPGFGRPLEDERIRRVQPDGSRKFQHVRLIRISDRAPADHTKRRVQAHPQDCSAPARRCRQAG